jgi:diguanylate cyclase (GGDEF)-like protein/PAS domain S-box-containing protein
MSGDRFLRFRLPLSLSGAAVLALVIGLAATAALFVGLRRLEHDKIELDFRQRAEVRVMAVKEQLEDTVRVLRILNQLFATIEPISRDQFQTFTQPLLASHPYIQAFNFHRYVEAAEKQAYEAQMRKRFPGFVLTELQDGRPGPVRDKPRHLVVDYIEPMYGNEAAFGLDVIGNALLADAVQRATDTGHAASSALLTLAQGGGKARGFLIVMPVYRHGMPLSDSAARRRATLGDTAAVFNAQELIDRILHANGLLDGSQIDISVYASDILDDAHLAYGKGVAAQRTPPASWLPQWVLYDHPQDVIKSINLAGRPWHIVVSEPPGPFSDRHYSSLIGLLAGGLVSLLLAAYLQTLSSRSRRIQQLIEQRTAQLRHANDLLTADIAARKRAEEDVRLRQRAIDASANAIIVTGANGPRYPVEYVNPAFERITGYSAAEVLGRSCGLLWADDRDQVEIQDIRTFAREQREGHVTLRTYTKDGRLFWSEIYIAPVRDESGSVNHFVVALYDVTATKRYQAELEYQATRDTLTSLANRNLLRDRLGQEAAYAERYGHPVWVLFLNLDRFKFVNDTLGHRAGDLLLKCVAERLQAAVRETDTVARLGGDEFVLVLAKGNDENLSPAMVQHIMDSVAQPIVIEGYEFVVSSSVGIAVCPSDGDDPEALIKHAGIAMYRAKETGRNNFQFYTSAMNESAMARLRIEGDLRNALERGEFVLHYQPQADMQTGHIVGVEALIRWQHPALGLVSPARFIPLAEEIGLIVPIGAWVLRAACLQSVEWQRAGFGQVRVAVNLSARQFYQQDLVASIKAILAETGIRPQLLELELTESMMMTDVEHAVQILRELKSLGLHLSIDDFGTGYSSLSHLKRFPIDLLKIDQSFVRDLTIDPDDASIVTSIISLAHSLRLKVIAEGVETEAQLAYLQRHHCDLMQGFYFSTPLPAAECSSLLGQQKRLQLATTSNVSRLQTLMIVDDDADVLLALARLLREDGYRVLTATNAGQAFEQLARNKVQVILCDHRMPDMEGAELLGKVKHLYPDIMRIMLSGHAAFDAVLDAINRGEIYRFFTKPWDQAVLRRDIRGAFLHYWNRRNNHDSSIALKDVVT